MSKMQESVGDEIEFGAEHEIEESEGVFVSPVYNNFAVLHPLHDRHLTGLAEYRDAYSPEVTRT